MIHMKKSDILDIHLYTIGESQGNIIKLFLDSTVESYYVKYLK